MLNEESFAVDLNFVEYVLGNLIKEKITENVQLPFIWSRLFC